MLVDYKHDEKWQGVHKKGGQWRKRAKVVRVDADKNLVELRWQGKSVSSVKEKVREHIPDQDIVIPPPATPADSGASSSADVPGVQACSR